LYIVIHTIIDRRRQEITIRNSRVSAAFERIERRESQDDSVL
jgi:hypothetical protein